MGIDELQLKHIKDRLLVIGEFQTKKMFGGVGFFKDGIMFAMIGSGVFRLRVDETNKADFEVFGMQPLTSLKKKGSMPYYEVPQEVLENEVVLKEWALKAFQVAKRNKKK